MGSCTVVNGAIEILYGWTTSGGAITGSQAVDLFLAGDCYPARDNCTKESWTLSTSGHFSFMATASCLAWGIKIVERRFLSC